MAKRKERKTNGVWPRVTKERLAECRARLLALPEDGFPLCRAEGMVQLEVTPYEWSRTVRSLLKDGHIVQVGHKRSSAYCRVTID